MGINTYGINGLEKYRSWTLALQPLRLIIFSRLVSNRMLWGSMRKVLISTLNWHPKVPFYYGWLVMATAALGAFVGTGVAQTVLGGVQDLIADDMGWNRTTIAFAATAGTWISGITMPFVGKLVDKYGPRGMMPIAVIIVSLGLANLPGHRG